MCNIAMVDLDLAAANVSEEVGRIVKHAQTGTAPKGVRPIQLGGFGMGIKVLISQGVVGDALKENRDDPPTLDSSMEEVLNSLVAITSALDAGCHPSHNAREDQLVN